MQDTWSKIVVALEQLGASSAVVRPGLYGRVRQRLLAANLLPPRLGPEPADAGLAVGAMWLTTDNADDAAPVGRRWAASSDIDAFTPLPAPPRATPGAPERHPPAPRRRATNVAG